MNIALLIIGIILLLFSVFLIIAVLMQQGKAHNLSGAIAGGAETFFGKSKAQSINKKLSILTTVVAIVFVILVIVVYVIQPNSQKFDWSMLNPFADNAQTSGTTNNSGVETDEHGHAAGAHDHETDAPATDAPATDAPATDAPATDAPATDAPATDAPATDAPEAGE